MYITSETKLKLLAREPAAIRPRFPDPAQPQSRGERRANLLRGRSEPMRAGEPRKPSLPDFLFSAGYCLCSLEGPKWEECMVCLLPLFLFPPGGECSIPVGCSFLLRLPGSSFSRNPRASRAIIVILLLLFDTNSWTERDWPLTETQILDF